MRRVAAATATVLALLAASCAAARPPDALVLGAMYPIGGGQGPGGLDEYRGVQLAAELANLRGGVRGRPVSLRLVETDSSDQAPGAVRELSAAGVPVILGSYGSTISKPAADASTREGRVFWETGAVGLLGMTAQSGERVFRFPPTGKTLGGVAVRFVAGELLPRLHRDPHTLRFGVAYVDDVYGRSVGKGALGQIRAMGLHAVEFGYDLRTVRYGELARRIARAGVDVLVVSAYVDDAVAMRRALVRARIPLVAGIGTSSSYCMPAFGLALGREAVGLFASDKPDGDVLDPATLAPEAGDALRWARERFRARYDQGMSAAALTGFSGAWALFHYVLPEAGATTPEAIAAAARTVKVPLGGLPNGSGLDFGRGDVDNRRATSVIWEWVKPRQRVVVWPRAYATSPIVPLSVS